MKTIFSRRQWLLALLILLSFPGALYGNELTRCCNRGEKHFLLKSSCAKIYKGRSTTACARSASICCLRALMDRTCDYGSSMALDDDYCPLSINQIGGGIRKECCECCLLAKDLVTHSKVCVAPTGFSPGCRRSFFKCCKRQQKTNKLRTNSLSRSRTIRFLRHDDRCLTAKCEQLCEDHGGESVECNCRKGYKLEPDGYSCADINECMLLLDNCLISQRCVNTPGSFKCVRTLPCGTGYVLNSDTGQCIDIDECKLGAHFCGPQYQCRNTLGSYRCELKRCAEREIRDPRTGECTKKFCHVGYKPVNGRCEDVNECEDGTHLCGDRPCVNQPGSYRCLCSAGFDFNEATKRCEDIDECVEFRGYICSPESFCENTYGSFRCHSIIGET